MAYIVCRVNIILAEALVANANQASAGMILTYVIRIFCVHTTRVIGKKNTLRVRISGNWNSVNRGNQISWLSTIYTSYALKYHVSYNS